MSIDHLADDTTGLERQNWAETRFLRESDTRGETALWCKVAYDVSERDSRRIFEQLVGGGFDAAEPTTVFFTQESVFVILSFKYTQINIRDQGQVLVAFEFSRTSKRLRTTYYLYSTTIFRKSTSELLAATAPYVAKAVAAYFGQ